jgi:ABC-2 type transport system ATP-binding protein
MSTATRHLLGVGYASGVITSFLSVLVTASIYGDPSTGRRAMTDDRPAVRAEGLRKSFGAVQALRGVDLTVARGTVVGLLGPNGAGKTTAVRILTTLLRPDGGHAEVDGLDVVRQAVDVRRRIGLAGQFAAVDPTLTGRENIELVGRLYHLPRAEARARAARLLERFDLVDAADRAARTYSGGMRRRLDLAASLVGEPSVLFLDEPTTGLDPRSRMGMWDVIRHLVREGTTLLLTTQYLEEADQLADRIVVIDTGQVIAEGTSDELKSRVGGDVVELTVTAASDLARGRQVLAGLGRGDPTIDESELRLRAPVGGDGSAVLADVVRALDVAGVPIADVTLRRPSLDDVFLALTGHVAEATAPAGVPDQPGARGGRGRRARAGKGAGS